ncbi:MAG: glycosyltransferase family 2 protein [Cyanobacteria bacterium P01_F01_bin.86]
MKTDPTNPSDFTSKAHHCAIEERLCILLATFNGEAYLAEQIESIVSQTHTNWVLIIRDDNSKDSTRQIVERFCHEDSRIILLQDHASAGSAKINFSRLMEHARAREERYFLCCDQDDVWQPYKLSTLFSRMLNIESNTHVSQPVLLHSDLEVVDKNLACIAESFIKFMRIDPGTQLHPDRLLSRNEVTGCSCIFNRQLLEAALPIPEEAIMHDWWLALVAAYFGHLRFCNDPLVKYRQHGNNVVGAKSFWHGLNPFNNWRQGWKMGNKEFMATIHQARAFLLLLIEKKYIEQGQVNRVHAYLSIPEQGVLDRLKCLFHVRVFRGHLLLDLVLILRVLLLPREKKQ